MTKTKTKTGKISYMPPPLGLILYPIQVGLTCQGPKLGQAPGVQDQVEVGPQG